MRTPGEIWSSFSCGSKLLGGHSDGNLNSGTCGVATSRSLANLVGSPSLRVYQQSPLRVATTSIDSPSNVAGYIPNRFAALRRQTLFNHINRKFTAVDIEPNSSPIHFIHLNFTPTSVDTLCPSKSIIARHQKCVHSCRIDQSYCPPTQCSSPELELLLRPANLPPTLFSCQLYHLLSSCDRRRICVSINTARNGR